MFLTGDVGDNDIIVLFLTGDVGDNDIIVLFLTGDIGDNDIIVLFLTGDVGDHVVVINTGLVSMRDDRWRKYTYSHHTGLVQCYQITHVYTRFVKGKKTGILKMYFC